MIDNISVINIREYLSDTKDKILGKNRLQELLSGFTCKKNISIERFFKKQSIEFTKKNQSVTYVVLTKDNSILLGYFTLAIKPIVVGTKTFSNRARRKIARVGELREPSSYSLSAYLIAQLGKNFSIDIDKQISGDQLLQTAMNTIRELQYMAGGMVMFLETEENDHLLHFYEAQNGFMRFDTRKTITSSGNTRSFIQLLKVM